MFIKSKKQYVEALHALERIMEINDPELDGVEIGLATLIQEYDKRHYLLDDPDPIEAILYVMEERGLKKKI